MDSHYQNGVIILSDSLCELHLRFDEICYIQTVKSQRKTIVCTPYGKFTINRGLGEIAARLDKRFIKIARHILVNRSYILLINKKERTLTLKNGVVCPYTRLFTR